MNGFNAWNTEQDACNMHAIFSRVIMTVLISLLIETRTKLALKSPQKVVN